MFGTAQPHIASYVILRKDNKIAFVLRENTSWMNGYYGLPSGKVENNESFTQAAIREAKEEVGIDINADDTKFLLTAHRHDKDLDWVDVIFEAVTWKGEPFNAEPHMHAELTWLDPKNLPGNVIESVRFYIQEIESGVTFTEYGWEA